MKKLIFLFTDGSSFGLELTTKQITRKILSAQLVAFQLLCLQLMTDQKRFAGAKTKFALPLSRPCWIGIDNGSGNVVSMYDIQGHGSQLKGYSIVDKIVLTPSQRDEDGKVISKAITKLQPSPDFVRFMTDRVLAQITAKGFGQVEELGVLDQVYDKYTNDKQLAKKQVSTLSQQVKAIEESIGVEA